MSVKNYSEMSDFEINGMVAAATQRIGDYTQARGLTFIHEYGEPTGEFGAICLGWKEFDPCNSWADAGPIIEEHDISLRKIYGSGWRAIKEWGDSHEHDSESPLRAAMIVFLMMHEAKNE